MRQKYLLIVSSFLTVVCLISITFVSLPIVTAVQKVIEIYPPVADAYVDSYNPESNYGGDNYLDVSYSNWSYLEDTMENAYLLFDLSEITIDTQSINSATLKLYESIHFGPTLHIGVYLCSNTEWSELEIIWSNAPAFSSEPLDVATVAFDDTWNSWDVTDVVKNSQGELLTLVLSVVGAGSENVEAWFHSKDSYFDNPPRIEIWYEATPEPPVASFTYSPLNPQVSDTITFDASGCSDPDGTIVSYLWDFGDGDTSTSQNPTHLYNQEGTYSVTLTVTDNDGLTDTTTLNIAEVVIPEFSSYMLLLGALTVVAVAIAIYKRKLKQQTR